MGVSNAPTTFQRIMELVLNGLNMCLEIIYIDDMVIPGQDFEHEACSLEKVLGWLERSQPEGQDKDVPSVSEAYPVSGT